MIKLKTTRQSRQLLLTRRQEARAMPLDNDGPKLFDRRSKAEVGLITLENAHLAKARARYVARACSLAPQLVADVDSLLNLVEDMRKRLASLPNPYPLLVEQLIADIDASLRLDLHTANSPQDAGEAPEDTDIAKVEALAADDTKVQPPPASRKKFGISLWR